MRYTRLLRDEVLAEWREDGLHVHCNVSVEGHWWISWAKSLRALVFRQKLPLVLDTLRSAERDLLMTSPQLLKAPVYVNFHGDGDGEGFVGSVGGAGGDGAAGGAGGVVDETGGGRWTPGVRECWGPLGDAGARGRVGGAASGGRGAADQRVSEEHLEAFSRARDLWAVGCGGDAAAATVKASLDDVMVEKSTPQQRNGGGGSGGGGGGGGGGLDLGTSRARSFAKNGVSSSSAEFEDVDALSSPVVKKVVSR